MERAKVDIKELRKVAQSENQQDTTYETPSMVTQTPLEFEQAPDQMPDLPDLNKLRDEALAEKQEITRKKIAGLFVHPPEA